MRRLSGSGVGRSGDETALRGKSRQAVTDSVTAAGSPCKPDSRAGKKSELPAARQQRGRR